MVANRNLSRGKRTHRAADDELTGLQGAATLVEVVDTPCQARYWAALGVFPSVP